MSSLRLNKDGSVNSSEWYIEPCSRRLRKGEVRKKAFFSKTKENIGKKNILCEVESILGLPPQICQIIRVHTGNGQTIQRNEASTL